jgi:nucleoside-diphosphate-sugar epimerase
MKRAVLTGGTGFVGANLARRLLREGHEVHLLVRPEHNPWRIKEIAHSVHLHEWNGMDMPGIVRTLDTIQPHWIFHLAAHGAYSWQNDFAQIVQTNVSGTACLVEAALQVGFEAFVNTGSSSEYGFKDHAPSEEEPVEPNSHYAVTKASATLYCRFSAQKNKVRIPTLRLYSVYGAYEDPNRLIPAIISNGLLGKWPPLVNPKISRDYVYIDDVCDAYLLAATTEHTDHGAIYNVGTGVQTSLAQVVETARWVMKIEAEPQWGSMPDRKWDTDIWVANSQKIQRELGWKPRYSFEAGLRESLSYYQVG